MSLQYLSGLRILGQSNDTKPTSLDSEQWTFEERDTGMVYQWNGSKWIYKFTTDEAKQQLSRHKEGSPLLRLTGDEFCTGAETSIYTLDNVLTDAVAGTALTNNGTITFAKETELPLRGFYVPTLNGSSQYFSVPTEAKVEVGTGSFIASIFHKNSTLLTAETIFSYGDIQASEQNWLMEITASGILQCTIDDGTNAVTISDSIASRWQDGRYHHFAMLVDRTTNIMYLFADGQIIASGSIGAVTLTLNNVAENFYIGARDNTGIGQFGIGQFSNFHLIKSADYNAITVLNQGIRESITNGVIPAPVADSAKRMNSKIILPATANSYTTCVKDLEDGEYEIQIACERQVAGGTLSLEIDGNIIKSLSTDGTAASNVISKTYGIKISAGKHIIKIKNTEANTIPLQWILFIKRNGHENGGVTEFLFLGDEINQRENASWGSSLTIANSDAYNNRITENTNGDLTEGDLFFKGGLWNFEITVREDTLNAGKIDFDIGSVEVLDQLATNAGVNLVTISKLVRLNQGKQNVRLAVVTGTGTPIIRIASIRGTRIND